MTYVVLHASHGGSDVRGASAGATVDRGDCNILVTAI
jgi:hypothetical protein